MGRRAVRLASRLIRPGGGVYISPDKPSSLSEFPKKQKSPLHNRHSLITEFNVRKAGTEMSYKQQGESIRIRLYGKLEQKLIAEKNRTGKSVSQITREALEQYFRKR